MKKFFNKLAKTFIGIGTSVVLFCKKMYALAPDTITTLYGPVMPTDRQEPTFWENAGELLKKMLISPITILVIVLIGVIVYLVKGENDKRTKILIVFAVILIFGVIILPLYLLSWAG